MLYDPLISLIESTAASCSAGGSYAGPDGSANLQRSAPLSLTRALKRSEGMMADVDYTQTFAPWISWGRRSGCWLHDTALEPSPRRVSSPACGGCPQP